MATYRENSCSFGLRNVSWYKYLIVSLVSSRPSVFWSGNLCLIVPFPDRCLLVPFYTKIKINGTFIFQTYYYDRSVVSALGVECHLHQCNLITFFS